jgi:hypothetical protein
MAFAMPLFSFQSNIPEIFVVCDPLSPDHPALLGFGVSQQEMVMPNQVCAHIDAVKELKVAKRHECEECIKIGGQWVHLRTCQQCGVTLCCDNSPNQHATKHAHATEHPVIASAEPGERWLYCYPDDEFVEY